MDTLSCVVTGVAAYLIGSIPTGFLVGQARGVDIRTVGSGNIGATNVLRTLGKPAGIFVLMMDALKGWLAVVPLSRLVILAFGITREAQTRELLEIIGGVCAILGHNYTCWLHFKGGKGIATSAGVLLALVPGALGIIFAAWIILFAATRYVSVSSIGASIALPLACWVTHESMTKIIVTGALAAMAVLKHKANIKRLFEGTEPRFQSKPGGEAAK